MSLTNLSREQIAKIIFGKNSDYIPDEYYIVLSKTAIGLDGSFEEADYVGYNRPEINNLSSSFTNYDPITNTIAIKDDIFFPVVGAGSQPQTIVAIALLSEFNNVWARGTLQTPINLEVGSRPVIEAGKVTFSFE